MTKNNYCTIYVVRHGQTDWNVLHKLQGHTDIPLNNLGIQEAKDLSKKFRKIKFSAAYSSDLSRAKKTAEIILADHKITITLKKVLRERFFGRTEGTTQYERDTIPELRDALARHFALSPEKRWHDKPFPNQETEHETTSRFINELRAIAMAHKNQNILVVSHGGTMRLLLVHLGRIPKDDRYTIRFSNTGYIKLRSDGVDFFIDDVVGLKKVES